MKLLILFIISLVVATPVMAQNNNKNVSDQSESSEWNHKICPNGIEDIMTGGNLIKFVTTVNPYDSKGKCYRYVGVLLQLLDKNKGLYSIMADRVPFAMINFGKESATMSLFNGVVKSSGAYSYTTVSGMQKVIYSFVSVPQSKEHKAWVKKKQEVEEQLRRDAKAMQEAEEAKARAQIGQEQKIKGENTGKENEVKALLEPDSKAPVK